MYICIYICIYIYKKKHHFSLLSCEDPSDTAVLELNDPAALELRLRQLAGMRRAHHQTLWIVGGTICYVVILVDLPIKNGHL